MPADVRDWGADTVGEGSEQMVSGIHRDQGVGRGSGRQLKVVICCGTSEETEGLVLGEQRVEKVCKQATWRGLRLHRCLPELLARQSHEWREEARREWFVGSPLPQTWTERQARLQCVFCYPVMPEPEGLRRWFLY